MINQNDVRLGNLVQYEGRAFKIATIADELPTLDTIEFGIGVVTWKDLEPIPLTPEWLERAGFECRDKINKGYLIKIHNNLDDYLYCNHRGVIALHSEILKDSPNSFVINRECKYVHQLQNLFFPLTGKELEFKEI